MKVSQSYRFGERERGGQVKTRIFYGWWIVTACVVMLTLVSGIGFYGLGVFLPSLEREFQSGPTLASLGTTIFFLSFGLAGPYVGRWIDRVGPRSVMVAGCVLFGAGLVALALSQQLWQTYLAYAVLAAGFSGTTLLPASALIAAWFSVRRGLAMGLTMTGLSFGGVFMVPLTTQLILAYGWRAAALVLAGLVWAIGVPLALLVIRREPGELGLLPDGVRSAEPRNPGRLSGGRRWSLAAAGRTRAFWALALGYMLISLTQTGVIVHQVRFLTYGTSAQGAITPQSAALVVSVTALASIVGRVALSTVVDRLNRRRVAVALIALQGLTAAGLLLARGNLAIAYVTVLSFGLLMGCVLMLHSLLVGDLFGLRSFGTIYGATLLIMTIGTAGGPWLAGFLFDSFGSYDVAFTMFAVFGMLAAAIVALARPPHTSVEAGAADSSLS